MSRPASFGNIATQLARNPLGIIALFIVLVYGFAALVLGLSAGNLDQSERLPIIWFLVVFPVIVLAAFYRLVTNHHHKLYAPEDFPNPSDFFRTMTHQEQAEQLKEEVREAQASEPRQAQESRSAEQRSTLDVYLLSEDLAFRELNAEFDVPVRRHLKFEGTGKIALLDGVLFRPGNPIVVEVKTLRSHQRAEAVVRAAIDFFSAFHGTGAGDRFAARFEYLLVLVTLGIDDEEKDKIAERAQKLLDEAPLPAQLRLYDYELLLERYGVN